MPTASPRYTPEFVERGYNNRAAVPEHPRFLAQYADLSRAAVASLHPKLDVRYGPGPKETLDLFLPPMQARGTFVFLHGGYWRTLDKADFSFVAPALVAQGLAVANVNYDLCPSVPLATIVEECRRAILWVAREGSAHGAPAAPLVVGGHSAGGHLTAMLFATDWNAYGLRRAPFAAGVTLSGVHDLEPLVLATVNDDLRLDEAEARRLSPVHWPVMTAAPLLVAVGADETSEFLRQSHLIHDAWPGNRPPRVAEPWLVPDRHHFSVVLDYADPESSLTRRTLSLFS